MHMAHLYPPGRVLWALHEGDLDPAQRLPDQKKGMDKLRLFEVQDVEQVFGQIVFAKDMLRYESLFCQGDSKSDCCCKLSYATSVRSGAARIIVMSNAVFGFASDPCL